MPTFNQLIGKKYSSNIRVKKKHKNWTKDLNGCPQKRAQCFKVTTRKPKKPNSAQRKIARVQLTKTGKKLWIYIPGIGHNLQPHSWVLIRGGRAKDVPGVKYKAIRGKLDFSVKEKITRTRRRSKYGLKNPKKEN